MQHYVDLEVFTELAEGYAIGKFQDENKWAVIDETGCISRRFNGKTLEDSTFRVPLISALMLDKVSFLPFKNGVSVIQINGRDPAVDDTGRRSLVLFSKSGIMNCFSYKTQKERQWWFEFLEKYFKSNRSFLMRKPEHFKDAEQLAFYADISQHGLLMRDAELENLEKQLSMRNFNTRAEFLAVRDSIVNQSINLREEYNQVREHFNYLSKEIEKRRLIQSEAIKNNANERIKGYKLVKLKDVCTRQTDSSHYGPVVL